MRQALRCLAAVMAFGPAVASAHTGLGDTAGAMHGFTHPLSGLDHALTMVAVGLLAARLGGRAVWALPLTFLCFMTVGAALGSAGIPLRAVETGIALSVLVLGLAIGGGLNLPLAVSAAVVGVFAVFHGHAHGAEIPDTVSGLAYGAGFLAATAILHAAGLALGLSLLNGRHPLARSGYPLAGGGIALSGLAILSGML